MASGSRNQEVTADSHDYSSSGLDMESNAVGQVTHFVSATRLFQNRELQNDATTSSTGAHTYYSTAPQELWTELLSKDLQDSILFPETQNNEGKSSCVEVHMLKQSEIVLLGLLAEGQRPKLPAHVNFTMKELLRACWHTKPHKRPGWTSIIKTLKAELLLHPPGSQQPKRRAQPWEQSGWKSIIKTLKEGLIVHPPGSQEPKRRAQPRIEMEREKTQDAAMTWETSYLAVTSWEEVAAQRLGREAFATWKAKLVLEIEPILMVILERRKALTQDTYNTIIPNFDFRVSKARTHAAFDEILYAFNEAWQLVEETWTNHVGRGFRPGESGTDLGSEMETLEEGQIDAKRETERTVREIWPNEALEPYNLLGPTAEYWLKEILATSKEWQAFRTTLNAWHSENEDNFQIWKDELQRASFAWEKVCVAYHACHVESPIAFIAWQALKNKEYSECREYMEFNVLVDTVFAEVYLKVHNAPKLEATMGSIKAWKAVEVERVTIRRLFLKNTIGLQIMPRILACR
ncbi:unnamed protein product [Sphagnum jensenii]|uniref:Uncharacterized protein n=1 Tax=Sphagnum jensenii TaxID=128206 RepID=A0ABP0W5G9_9BRYO